MKLPNLKSATPNPIPLYKQISKNQLIEDIWEFHGIITLICAKYDVSYTQFYRALHKWELEEELKKAKEMFVDEANKVIFEAMGSETESTRLRAAETVLRYSTPKTPDISIQTSKDGDALVEIKGVFGLT